MQTVHTEYAVQKYIADFREHKQYIQNLQSDWIDLDFQ